MKNLEWYVYREDINARVIEKFNIFNHYRFNEDVKKAYKKYKEDFNTFSDKVKSSLMYYFWSKCEYEIILSAWPPCDRVQEEKVDVYDQVMLNWNIFIKYVWEELSTRKSKTKKNETKSKEVK